MAFMARLVLLVFFTLPVLAMPSFGEPPDVGAAEAPLDLDGADGADTAEDAVLVTWDGHRPGHPQGNAERRDVEAPEGPPLPLAERPPNV